MTQIHNHEFEEILDIVIRDRGMIELVPLAAIVLNAAIVAYALAIAAPWALVAFLFSGASVYLIVIAF